MKQNKTRFFCVCAFAAALLYSLTACSSSARSVQTESVPSPMPLSVHSDDAMENAPTAPKNTSSTASDTTAEDGVAEAEVLAETDTLGTVTLSEPEVPLIGSPEYVPAPATGMPALQSAPSMVEPQAAPATVEPQAAPATVEPQVAPATVEPQAAPATASVPPMPTKSGTALTRREAIAAGHVVLAGKRSVPSHNADTLLAFYDNYRAGREASVAIYSYRTQNDDERHYTLHTLSVLADGKTRMTENTTYYHDPTRDGASSPEVSGVHALGAFTMTKNRYGFIAVDVDSNDGKLQYHYQVTGYDELYPTTVQYADEAARYLAPLAGTGILELSWSNPKALLTAGVFPQAFEQLVVNGKIADRSIYWNEQLKTYCYPRELIETPLYNHFGLTPEQLRTLPVYGGQSESYNYVSRGGNELSDLRLLALTELPATEAQQLPVLATGERYLQLRYEFFNAEDGSPISRGKLTVIEREDDSFRYVANELLPPPATEE